MIIEGWNCTELYPGTDWRIRSAVNGRIELTSDHDGLEVSESFSYLGASGQVFIPANVLVWLADAVR